MKLKKQVLLFIFLIGSFFLVGCGKKDIKDYVNVTTGTINLQKFYDDNITIETKTLEVDENYTEIKFKNKSNFYINFAKFELLNKKTNTEVLKNTRFCLEPSKEVVYYADEVVEKKDLSLKGEIDTKFYEENPVISEERLDDMIYSTDIEIVNISEPGLIDPDDKYSDIYFTTTFKNNSGKNLEIQAPDFTFYGVEDRDGTTDFNTRFIDLHPGTEPVKVEELSITDKIELQPGDNPIVLESYDDLLSIQYTFEGTKIM